MLNVLIRKCEPQAGAVGIAEDGSTGRRRGSKAELAGFGRGHTGK